jgi:adenosylhomocysteine nucleosidase
MPRSDWTNIITVGMPKYVIDHFHPARLFNIGTCGGEEGRINRFDVVAVEKVIIYDIAEAMSDSKEAIADYSTMLPLLARFPVSAVKAAMYSGDRDLTAGVLRELDPAYQPVVADWESGATAWIAHKNATPVLILRGVTDLVYPDRAEAQGDLKLFENNAVRVMRQLIADLPGWIAGWR